MSSKFTLNRKRKEALAREIEIAINSFLDLRCERWMFPRSTRVGSSGRVVQVHIPNDSVFEIHVKEVY